MFDEDRHMARSINLKNSTIPKLLTKITTFQNLHAQPVCAQPLKLLTSHVFTDVTVIMGGENDKLISASLDTVETFSLNCGGLFQSRIPPLPKPRRQAAAAYLDGK
jgi:hypothetical protein